MQVERGAISEVYSGLTETVFADSYNLDVVLERGEIQEIAKEVIRMSETLRDITSLIAQCLYIHVHLHLTFSCDHLSL